MTYAPTARQSDIGMIDPFSEDFSAFVFKMCIRDRPCIILKSDGASLYSTTDLATLVMRMKENNPCLLYTSRCV